MPSAINTDANVRSHEFTVTNPYGNPLTITDISRTCACLKAEIAKRTLPAFGTTSLMLSIDLRGKSGPVRADCVLTTDTGESWRYSLTGHVYHSVECVPPAIDIRGDDHSQIIEKEVTVVTRSGSATPPTPTLSLMSGSADVQCTRGLGAIARGTDGVLCRHTPFTIRITRPPVQGSDSCDLATTPTYGADPRESWLRISWHTPESYVATPSRLFVTMPATERVRETITVTRKDGAPFYLSAIETNCRGAHASCSTVNALAEAHALVVDVQPDDRDEFVYGHTLITCKGTDNAQIRIPIAVAR